MKTNFLTVAEVIDAFRAVPRAILVGYALLVWEVVDWYMLLEAPTTQQAALVTAVVGIIAPVAGFYQSSGRSWKNNDKD